MRWLIPCLIAFFSISTSAAPFTCPKYEFQKKEFSFESMNPTSEVIDGIRFPGNGKILYRGIYESNPQFDLISSLQAMFRQKDWHVGSPIFYGITQVLRGQWDLEHTLFPSGNLPLKMRDYLTVRKILPDMEILLGCLNEQPMDLLTSQVYAADLMNKTFFRMTRAEVESRYFNIKDAHYYNAVQQQYGFGNNAADLLISTSYDLIAALYGNKILVLQDTRKRALDLSFFNKKKNNVYYDSWVDNGEINSPGYITAEEVLGFQKRYEDRARTNWAAAMSTNAIDVAYYRMEYKNTAIVLVLDGQKKLCIMKAEDNRYYECNDYYTGLAEKPVPYPNRKNTDFESRAPLIGIITDCTASTQGCPSFQEIQKWYGKNAIRTLPQAWIQKIEATIVNGKKLNWQNATEPEPPPITPTPDPETELPPPVPPPPPKPAQTLKVVSAFYSDSTELAAGAKRSVLAPASEFLDDKEAPIVFKVSARHLKFKEAPGVRRFEIRWTCSGERKIYSHTVPAPAEGKSFWVYCGQQPAAPPPED